MSTAPAALSGTFFDTMLEAVAPVLEDAFEKSTAVASLIQSRVGDVEEISSKLFRIPVKIARGSDYQAFNPNGGGLGRGAGPKYMQFLASRVPTRIAIEYTYDAEEATNSPQKAKATVRDIINDAVEEAQRRADIELHGSGNGVLTHSVGASATTQNDGGVTSYTFASATDMLGIVNLNINQTVSVFTNNGQTKKYNNAAGADGKIYITNIDPNAKKVFLNVQIDSASPATGDVLTIAGATANLTTGSNYAGTPPATSDTARLGIPYFNSASGSDYLLGVVKNTIPHLLATQVQAGGAYLSYLTFQTALDKVIERREDYRSRMVGIMNMAQRASLTEKGYTLQKWERGSGGDDMFDMIPKNFQGYDQMFEVAGVKCMVSKRQPKDRVDVICPEVWGRAQAHAAKWYEVNGQRVFEARSTDGGVATAFLAYYIQYFNFYCKDPARQFYITGLGVPASAA